MAARGDFTVEHDNYAELHLSAIDFESLDESDVEDKDFHKSMLQVAVLHSAIKSLVHGAIKSQVGCKSRCYKVSCTWCYKVSSTLKVTVL